jgi:hypothetical protein
VTVLAATRPDSWNFPLLLHILGAMVLVGAMLAAATALLLGWRRDAASYTRFAFWTLLVVGLPGFVVMRGAAQWIYDKEGFTGEDDPTWIGLGFTVGDLGVPLFLITLIVTGVGARRLRRPDAATSVLTRVGGVLSVVLLLSYVVAVWAMSAKPG